MTRTTLAAFACGALSTMSWLPTPEACAQDEPEIEILRLGGVLRPERSVELEVPSSREVVAVHVVPGEVVDSGQPLVELDRRDLELDVAEAHAGIERAKGAIEDVRVRLHIAELEIERAHQELERVKAEEGAESPGARELEVEVKLAKARLEHTASLRAQVHAEYDAARVRRERAELALSKSAMRAPVRGVVARVEVGPGDTAHPREAIVVIDATEVLIVEVGVSPRMAERIDREHGARVTSRGQEEEIIAGGRVRWIAPPREGETHATVRVEVDASDGAWRVGDAVQVELPLRSQA